MPQLLLEYSPRSTELERLERLAVERGLTREQLAKRFISEGLAGYGLKDVEDGEGVKDLNDYLEKTGAHKKT